MLAHIDNVHIHFNQRTPALASALIAAIMAKAAEPAGQASAEADPTLQPEDPPEQAGTTLPPKIGDVWPGMGGIYAGIARGLDGQPDYHLILAEAAPEADFSWEAGKEFARTVEADGHTDFELPTRWESALLYANVRDKVDTSRWHWTATASGESDAFLQHFFYGYQDYGYRSYAARCRFVRRSVL